MGNRPSASNGTHIVSEKNEPSTSEPNAASSSSVEEAKKKLSDVFGYVEAFEESRIAKKSDVSFIRKLEGNIKEKNCWTDHYFHNGTAAGASKGGVLLSSYQVEEWKERVKGIKKHIQVHGGEKDDGISEVPKDDAPNSKANDRSTDATGTTDAPIWLQLSNPSLLTIPTEGPIHDFLQRTKELIKDKKKGVKTNADVLEFIKPDEFHSISYFQAAPEVFRQFYHEYHLAQKVKPIYKRLFEFKTSDDTAMELVFSFGQLRQRFTTTATTKKAKPDDKFINAPLIEVAVDVNLSKEIEGIDLVPAAGARVKTNLESKDLLIKAGGGHSSKAKGLDECVAEGLPNTLSPGNWKTYEGYLTASKLGWDTLVREPDSKVLHHPPDDPETTVLSPGWCLSLRPKRSTTFSKDAHAIKIDIERGVPIPPPLHALIHGSPTFVGREEQPAHFPLRASPAQREVIQTCMMEKKPILAVQGAPGTGKSLTGLNSALIGAAKGEKSLITALSPATLEEFAKKIPGSKKGHESIHQMFCLEISCLDQNRTTDLANQLECMHVDLTNMIANKKDYSGEASHLETVIAKKKNEEKSLFKEMEEVQLAIKDVLEDQALQIILKEQLQQDDAAHCGHLTVLDDYGFLGIVQDAMVEGNEEIDFAFHSDPKNISIDLQSFVVRQTGGPAKSSSRYNISSESSHPASREIEQELSKIEIRGERRKPNGVTEWRRVDRGLKVLKKWGEFKKRTNLSSEQENLLVSLFNPRENRNRQRSYHKLREEIQRFEWRLTELLILERQKKLLTEDDMSKLNLLMQAAQKLKGSNSKSRQKSDAGNFELFKTALRPCLKFIPLVLMTTEQVCEIVPLTHRFDHCIIDEASQMNCTGLNLLIRANQFLVLGDQKQSSPAEQKWSVESKNALAAIKPDTYFSECLKPGESFFDLIKQAVPKSYKLLSDHFRCPANGIEWNNVNVYHDRIKTYKPSRLDSVTCMRVDGKWVDKVGNRVEAQAVVNFVVERLKMLPAKAEDFAIYIISMGGPKHADCIDGILQEALDQLYAESKGKERHKVMTTADQKQVQGGECDLVVLSAGHSPGNIPVEVDPHHEQFLNVVGSRHTQQIVLFHSYGIKDMQREDLKRDFFQTLMKNAVGQGSDEEESPKDRTVRFAKVIKMLCSTLRTHGYCVQCNRGTVWADALTITRQGERSCALLLVENSGETADEWGRSVEDQYILECSGTRCLRVDAISLALCFRKATRDILAFLNESMPLGPSTVDMTPSSLAQPPSASEQEEIVISSESESSDLSCLGELQKKRRRPSSSDKAQTGHMKRKKT